MTSAAFELDPVFVKALKLLQSRSKDSGDQLKAMLDEVLAQRKADTASDGDENPDGSTGSKFTVPPIKKEKDSPDVNSKKRELEKSNLEKLKQDLASLSQPDTPSSKKIKFEPPEAGLGSSSSTSPRASEAKERDKVPKMAAEPPKKEPEVKRLREIEEDIFFGPQTTTVFSLSKTKERERLEREERERAARNQRDLEAKVKVKEARPVDSDSDTEISDNDGERGDGLDETFELELGSLSCVHCKTMSVTQNNRLVECQECHSLYHQECHRPPVTENVNDPRFVWYCSKCAKNMKKIVSKTQKKSKPPTSSRDSPVTKSHKVEPISSILQPFKRFEPTKPSVNKELTVTGSTSSNTGGRGLSGLASLAANLNNKSSSNDLASKNKSDPVAGRIPSSRPDLPKPDPSHSKPSILKPTESSAFRPSPLGKVDGSKLPGTSGTKIGAPKLPAPPVSVSVASGSKISQGIMSPDKRLSIMKKKAAEKMNQKRTSSK